MRRSSSGNYRRAEVIPGYARSVDGTALETATIMYKRLGTT
jgi:hypothetical protein